MEYVGHIEREVEIFQWTLLQLHERQAISLLPGEGIALTLRAYCLDPNAASPEVGEFYYLERLSDRQREWIIPLLDYESRNVDDDLPTQALIWNIGRSTPYGKLPTDQQRLFDTAAPEAASQYRSSILDSKTTLMQNVLSTGLEILGEILGERRTVETAVGVFDNISTVASLLRTRKSELPLSHPKHDAFTLDNGLLVKANSTGNYDELTVTVVNPKADLNNHNERLQSQANIKIAFNEFGSQHDGYRGISDARLFAGNNGWKKYEKKATDWTDRYEQSKKFYKHAKEYIDFIDKSKHGIDGVETYLKSKSFKDSLDVFKSLHKGNPQMEKILGIFEKWNLQILENKKKTQERPDFLLKHFKPSEYQFKSGRSDVQPLVISSLVLSPPNR